MGFNIGDKVLLNKNWHKQFVGVVVSIKGLTEGHDNIHKYGVRIPGSIIYTDNHNNELMDASDYKSFTVTQLVEITYEVEAKDGEAITNPLNVVRKKEVVMSASTKEIQK